MIIDNSTALPNNMPSQKMQVSKSGNGDFANQLAAQTMGNQAETQTAAQTAAENATIGQANQNSQLSNLMQSKSAIPSVSGDMLNTKEENSKIDENILAIYQGANLNPVMQWGQAQFGSGAEGKMLNGLQFSENLLAASLFTKPVFLNGQGTAISTEMSGAEANVAVNNAFSVDLAQGTAKATVINADLVKKNLDAASVFIYPVVDQQAAVEQDTLVQANKDEVMNGLEKDAAKASKIDGGINAKIDAANAAGQMQMTAEKKDGPAEGPQDSTVELVSGGSKQIDQHNGLNTNNNMPKVNVNWDAFNSSLRSNLAASNNQFKIRLEPENLGQLDFKMTKNRDGQITASMASSSKEVVEYFKSNIDKIKATLLDQGIKLESFVVDYKPDPSSASTDFAHNDAEAELNQNKSQSAKAIKQRVAGQADDFTKIFDIKI